jgi:hypothetical protein
MTAQKRGQKKGEPEMTNKLTKTAGMASIGMALLLCSAMTPAFGADLVKADVPFAFQVGKKTLPAGAYEFQLDLQKEIVTIAPVAKGPEAAEPIVTYIATPAHSSATDSHVVFDVVGSNHILSEIWRPGMDGILVHVTKGPHTHHILHSKR